MEVFAIRTASCLHTEMPEDTPLRTIANKLPSNAFSGRMTKSYLVVLEVLMREELECLIVGKRRRQGAPTADIQLPRLV